MENDPLLRAAERILAKRRSGVEDITSAKRKMFGRGLALTTSSLGVFALIAALFTFTFSSAPILVWCVVSVMLILCLLLEFTFSAQHPWMKRMGRLCLIALGAGIMIGLFIYFHYTMIYNAYFVRRVYRDVLANTRADRYIDAGRLDFNEDSKIDTDSSVGYKAFGSSVYCVAPIRDVKMTDADEVNYYAVGTNCCDERAKFECNDAMDPAARSGMVLLDPELLVTPILEWVVAGGEDRVMYEKAIKMQNAYFGQVRAPKIIFVKWTKDPASLAGKYHTDGVKCLLISVCVCLVASLTLGFLNAKREMQQNVKD